MFLITSFEKLLSDAGASVAGHYAAAKFAVVREASTLASVKLAMEEAEQQKEREEKPTEIPAEESITGEPIPLDEEAEVEA